MVDIPADASTTVNLTLGVGTSSTIDVALDHDWFRVTLVAGTTYSFVTSGTATGALTDTTLTLRNAGGTQLAFNDDAGGGFYSRITFTAAASGVYYLDVGGYQSLVGNYNLIAQQAAALPTYTNDQISNQLINGYWNFAGSSAHHWNVAPGGL